MTDPQIPKDEPRELDLDVETVADLEPSEADVDQDQIRGGAMGTRTCACQGPHDQAK